MLILKKNYILIAGDLSKQKALNAYPKASQQIIFTGKTDNTISVYNVLEQSKETILEFAKGTKSCVININGWI